MNRTKKIRGHKKIQKRIQNWIEKNKNININDFLANKYSYAYVSFNPYFNISINNSHIAEPKGKTRKQIILGLQEIYNSWKIELDKLNEPYYLKIYLFEPRISKSQVICAIGKENIEYYKNFFRLENNANKRDSNFQKILSSDFIWKTHSDDDIYSEQELLSPESNYKTKKDYKYCIKLLTKLKKKNYTKIEAEDENDYLYYLPKGKVIIGGK